MKIKTVIRAFKKILPIYEKYYNISENNEHIFYRLLCSKDIASGLCYAMYSYCNITADIFTYKGYYKNYIKNGLLTRTPTQYYFDWCKEGNSTIKMKKCLKFRIDFLKREIKHLEKLSLKYDEI